MISYISKSNYGMHFGLIQLLIVARFLTDGLLKFDLFGQPVTLYFAALLAIYGLLGIFLNFEKWIPLLLLLIYLLSSALFGFADWGVSGIQESVRTLAIFGIYIISVDKFNRLGIFRILSTFTYLMTVNSLFAIVQFFLGAGFTVDGVRRFSGFLAHPNSAALLAASALIFLQLFHKDLEMRGILFCRLLLFCGLILSLSFMGILTFVFMSAVVVVFQSGGISRILRFLTLASISTFLLFIFNSGFHTRVLQFTTSNSYQVGAETNSFQWRLDRWKILLEFWKFKPLLGQGYGTSTSGLMLDGYVPHNEYIRILIELGMFGSLLVLLIYGFVFRSFFLDYKLTKSREAIFVCALMLGGGLNATAENTFQYTLWGIFLMLAMAVRTHAPHGQIGRNS